MPLTDEQADRIVAERKFAQRWANEVVSVMDEFYGLRIEPGRREQLVTMALMRASEPTDRGGIQ